MKKLILHVGYPKTATTTLQNTVLTTLHQQGLINYLGRSSETSLTKSSVAFHLQQHLLLNKKFPKQVLSFRDDIPNVLSDEELTSPGLYLKLKHGVEVDPLSFPRKIKELFGAYDLDIEVVFVLRKQPDLMYSWYAQLYRYFGANRERTVTDHTFDGDGLRQDRFLMYDFERVISTYAESFGKDKVSVQLYECLKEDTDGFCQFWAEKTCVPKETIAYLFEKSHLNRKGKKGNNAVVTATSYTPMAILKALRVIPEPVKVILRKVPGLKNALTKRSSDQSAIEVAHYTSDERALIQHYFDATNSRLTAYGISMDQLMAYKYIN